jgi:hypothetical protein
METLREGLELVAERVLGSKKGPGREEGEGDPKRKVM